MLLSHLNKILSDRKFAGQGAIVCIDPSLPRTSSRTFTYAGVFFLKSPYRGRKCTTCL
jgi:hypothetical protein